MQLKNIITYLVVISTAQNDEDPCDPNPCGPGKCEFKDDDLTCKCDFPYFGLRCELKNLEMSFGNPCEPNPCASGCMVDINSQSGYTCYEIATTLSPEVRPLVSNSDLCNNHVCQNFGVCIEKDGQAKCWCEKHFYGEFCESFNFHWCENDYCFSNGTQTCSFHEMNSSFVCNCDRRYSGDLCQDLNPMSIEDYKYLAMNGTKKTAL